MLAVATARELSQVSSTLILDLDFFNRGLAGLLGKTNVEETVVPPSFLGESMKQGWSARKVAENLYTIAFPDIEVNDINRLGGLPVSVLSDLLKRWIEGLCTQLQCRSVILDCHGGPDALSFAAVEVSDKALLVSEPDKITMYGTMHFLRRLSENNIGTENVHLVFNKVVESFTSMFLTRVYNVKLREYFDNKDLLATFPLEVYLTKHFEHHPFVTEDFPDSMLARKSEVMVADLFRDWHDDLIPERARRLSRFVSFYRRRTFGRTPKFFRLDFVMTLSFVVLVAVVAAISVEKLFLPDEMFEGLIAPIMVAIPMLAGCTTLLYWSRYLDRGLTLSSRRKRWVRFLWYSSLFVLLWVAPIVLVGYLLSGLPVLDRELMAVRYVWYIIVAMICGVWIVQIFKAVQDIRYTTHRIEPGIRALVGFVVLVGAGVLVAGIPIVERTFKEWFGERVPVAYHEFREEDLPNITNINWLTVNGHSVDGQTNGNVHWYGFDVRERGLYVVSVTSDDGDSTVGLFGPDTLVYVTEDDDGGRGRNAKIRRCLEDLGKYYISVRDLFEREFTYSVNLTMQSNDADGNGQCENRVSE